MFSRQQPQRIRFWLGINLVISLGYYGLAQLSRHLASTPNDVTPVWPPDGWAVGFALLYGNATLPGVFLGSFWANLGAFSRNQSWGILLLSGLSIVGIALGTTLGTALGTSLMKRTIQHRYPFDRVSDTVKFLIFSGLLGPLINATVGVAMLVWSNQVPWQLYGSTVIVWWVSNVSGILILTPVILSWHRWLQEPNWVVSPTRMVGRRGIESLCLVVLLLGIAQVSFYGEQSLAYMLVPLLVWAGFRLAQPGATMAVLWTAAIAITGTVQGLGTFASPDLNQALTELQSFIAVISFTVLILGAVLAERRSVTLRLREAVTELRQANNTMAAYTEELAQSSRLKDEFLGTISHELRTPLVGILGMSEILQEEGLQSQSEQLDALQTISHSGEHLLALIDDILNVTNLKSGQITLSKKVVSIASLCQASLGIMAPIATKKTIRLSSQIPPGFGSIEVDPKRIQQVFTNLLSNAVKFTPEGGEVSLQVDEPSLGHIRFTIEDNGIGIPEQDLEQVFERFFQSRRSRTQTEEGIGLGLAIAKQLVELHQGTIGVSSRLDQGSRFTVELPRTAQFDSSSSGIVPAIVPPQLSDTPYILIAEDDRINQAVLKRHLERYGYRLVIVQNGKEAVDYAQQERPALILMDLQMPVMGGLEAIRILRQNPHFETLPIVVLTAFTRAEDQMHCFQAGATRYLTKPVQLKKLLRIVQTHLPPETAAMNNPG